MSKLRSDELKRREVPWLVRSKLGRILPYIFLAYALGSYYLHSVGFWEYMPPFDWLIALILYIELRLQKLKADILEAVLRARE